MREQLREVVSQWYRDGRCDFSAAISLYPISVICALIGISRQDVTTFETWLEKLESAYAQDARALPELNRIIASIFDYLDGVLAPGGSRPASHGDLLQRLLDLTEEGGLTDEEMRCLLIVLLGAGYDTTKNQLTFILYLMTQHPEHWRRAAVDPGFVKPLIEESLRYMNPIGAMHRVTNVDITYRGIDIPADTFFSLSQMFRGAIRRSMRTRIASIPSEPIPSISPSARARIFVSVTSSRARCWKRRFRSWRARFSIPASTANRYSARPWGPGACRNLPLSFTPGKI